MIVVEGSAVLDSVDETIDLEAIRKKYREERDRRLQVPDRANYTLLQGELAERYDRDLWAPTDGSRAPVSKTVEAVILGGGFGGLLAGAHLRMAGLDPKEICIIDRGSDFGGTWYWNKYPGLCCDIESYCYLPLLEETNYIPKQKYSTGPEIYEHCQRIGRQFGLYEEAVFQTLIIDATWDEADHRWVVKTDRGDDIRARFLFNCRGGVSFPKLPGVPGLETFKGHSFHTMRWDYGYTGGSPTDPALTKLADKRVALIGTGATAIQCVPPLGEWSKELYVVQRTPSAVIERANRPTDMKWASELQPGWQRRRIENFINVMTGAPEKENLVDDGWTRALAKAFHLFGASDDPIMQPDVQERLDIEVMNGVRARVDRIVKDKAVAEALKPWYSVFCKRPTFHDEYLQTFNRKNVMLVDAPGGVERFTENGLVAEGREYPLDCIVFSTGFDTQARGAAINPRGMHGVTFKQRLMKSLTTLHGTTLSGFPNMFVVGNVQGPLAPTQTFSIELSAEHAAKIAAFALEHGKTRVEAKPEAEACWAQHCADAANDYIEYFEKCTPGYYNADGQGSFLGKFYGGGPQAYARIVDKWRKERMTEDLAFC